MMALPSDPGANGATPANNQLVTDAELADWVYHRAANDQGLGLQEIEANAVIYGGPSAPANSFKTALSSQGYTFGDDGFIYNKATGFCCAVVYEGDGNYAIVMRGTDAGDLASSAHAVADSLGGIPSNTPGTTDELDVYQDIVQGAGTLAPTQSEDVLNVVAALKSAQSGANIRLVGQSLGGGDAAVAAVVSGLHADVFDPAPFAAQVGDEAIRSAAQSVGVTASLTPYLASATLGASGRGTVLTVGSYIQRTYGSLVYAKFLQAYKGLVGNGTENINAYRVNGEFLTAGISGWVIGTNSSQINYANLTSYEVGQSTFNFGGAVSLHSPTLIALVAATGGNGTGFAKLLQDDTTLFDAFVGNSAGNVGAESHNRTDDPAAAGTSLINVSGADPTILERALLKTAGSQTGFYTYFSNVFGALLKTGVVAAPAGEKDPSDLTLHTAFERLALDVFRDKVTQTGTVDAIDARGILGAVGGSGVSTLSDAIVIHKSDITATATDELDPSTGLQFGETEVDRIVWNDLRSALGSDQLTEQVLGKRHDKIFGEQIIGSGPQELGTIASTAGQGLSWTVAVAQAGSAAGSFKFDPGDTTTGARSGDADQNLLVFGGNGTNDIKGGNKNDIIITGDGTTTVEAGNGNAIIVAGKGVTTVNAGSGSNTIIGGSGSLTLNAVSAGASAPSTTTTETLLGGSGNCTINVDCSIQNGPSVALLEGGTGTNTFNFTNVDQRLLAPNSTSASNFFIMWGGGGNTTYNFSAANRAYYGMYVDAINVTGLTRENFDRIDGEKLTQYLIDHQVVVSREIGVPLEGIILRSGSDHYQTSDSTTSPLDVGVSTDFGEGQQTNRDYSLDITQFLKSPDTIDPVLGNGGTSYFTSSSSDVTLDFGKGNNTVWHGGETFGETFTYARSDGNEVVDAFTSGGSTDVLQLTDLNAADVSLAVTESVNLLITDKVTGETIRVLNQYVDATGRYGLKTIAFSDGTTLDLSSPGTIQLVKGSSGYLYDGVTNSTVSLQGGVYVDHAQGETTQTYVYHSGDGSSVINALSPATTTDTLSLADLTAAQVTLTRVGADLLVKVASNGDVLRIKNQFSGAGYGIGSIAFSDGTSLSAAQITSSATNGIDSSAYVTTTASNSTVTLTSADQTFSHDPGTSGETYLYASADGNETLDLQTAAGASDSLRFSDLKSSDVTATIVDGYNLRLTINATGKSITVLNEFLGTAGTFGLANVAFQDVSLSRSALLTSSTFTAPVGATYLYDPLSGTTVRAGAGDQYITHSKGETSQTYLYAKGDGNDVISAVTPGGSSDVLKFTDMNATDVLLTKSGNDLLVTTIANGQVIRVVSQFGDNAGRYGVSSVVFANGRTYDRGSIATVVSGNAGASYAPIIDGTAANQNVTDSNPVTPFSGVTIVDPNTGATDTLYITFAGGTGVLTDGSGFSGLKQTGSNVYSLAGTAAQISAELRALTFTPVGNQPNTTSTVIFSLSDYSSSGTNVTDSTTTVVDKTSAAAPVIAGTAANQSAVTGATETPFAQTIIVDQNMGTTLALSIQVTGGGTLADGGQFTGLKSTATPGLYTLSGTDAAVTAELQALTFTRSTAGTSQISLSVTSSAGTSASDTTTSVVVGSGAAVAPTISGTQQLTTTSEAPVTPFSKVVIGDTNAGATDSLYITLYGSGTLTDGTGFSGLSYDASTNTYALSGTPASITSELNALIFKPGAGPANTAYDTSFTLYVASSAGTNAADNTTTVTDVDPAVAPTISGTHNLTTTSETAVTPFTGVTVGDVNNGATDTLYINLYGSGSLADGAGFSGLTAGQGTGAYVLSGTAAAITKELDALVFTPGRGGPATAYDTTIVLYAASSAGTGAGDNSTVVTDVDPAVAPQISNFSGAFTTTSRQAVHPFNVSLSDANINGSDTATIQMTGGGGTLADGSGFHGLSATSTPGVYTVAASSAANLANEINALSFTASSSTSSAQKALLTVSSSAGPTASAGAISFSGTGQNVSLGGTAAVAISDLGHALNIAIGSSTQTDTISGFGTTDTTGVIDFKNGAGGFASVSDVVAALHSDGHSGTLLNLGSSGSIDFLNTPQSQLHASNFKIG